MSTRNGNDVVAVRVYCAAATRSVILLVPGSGTTVSVTLGWSSSSEGGQGGDGGDESELHRD